MTGLLFTISIFAEYRGTKEIYSAKVIAPNGTPLYHLAEALSIPEAGLRCNPELESLDVHV
ncbi:MAG TPA: hypothetical protein VHR84_11380 [Terriglobales bacterium]|jgi:hypothetical protein|nr:hypothetical protein [Terriglobales bacterium]